MSRFYVERFERRISSSICKQLRREANQAALHAHYAPVRELKDMTPEEIAAIEQRYGAKAERR